MLKIKKSSFVLLILLCAGLARAEDYPERRIPDVPTMVLDKVEYKCFNNKQYGYLLEMSMEHQALRMSYYLNLPASTEKLSSLYEIKIALERTEKDQLKTRVEDLNKLLQEQQAAHLAEVKDLKRSNTGWKIFAGVSTGLFLVSTGYALIK